MGIGTGRGVTLIDELDELIDVVIDSPTSGQSLIFNGTSWVNASAAGGVSVHNSLSGLQGGTSGEFYHLTSAQHNAVQRNLLPLFDNGSSGASITINWNNGKYQSLTLTANCSIAHTTTSYPSELVLYTVQASAPVTTFFVGTQLAGGIQPIPTQVSAGRDKFTFDFDGSAVTERGVIFGLL